MTKGFKHKYIHYTTKPHFEGNVMVNMDVSGLSKNEIEMLFCSFDLLYPQKQFSSCLLETNQRRDETLKCPPLSNNGTKINLLMIHEVKVENPDSANFLIVPVNPTRNILQALNDVEAKLKTEQKSGYFAIGIWVNGTSTSDGAYLPFETKRAV